MFADTNELTTNKASGINEILNLKNISNREKNKKFDQLVVIRQISLEKQVKELQDQFRNLNLVEE